MSNSTRPHRRLSLTLPSTAPETPEVVSSLPNIASVQGNPPHADQTSDLKSTQIPSVQTSVTNEETAEPETVRVMAYLTSEEAQILDELWLLMRRKHGKVSKSDILRASLTMAFTDQENLSSSMSEQQVSTSSRQRSSKLTRK